MLARAAATPRRLWRSNAERRDFLDSFGDATLPVTPDAADDVIAADPAEPFLKLAVARGRRDLVSGDCHLTALGASEGS